MKKSFWRNAVLPKNRADVFPPNVGKALQAVPYQEIIENPPYSFKEDPATLTLNLQIEAPENTSPKSQKTQESIQEELRKMIHEEISSQFSAFAESISKKQEGASASADGFDGIKSDLQKACREQSAYFEKRLQSAEDHFEKILSEQAEVLNASRKQLTDLEEQVVHSGHEITERIVAAEKHFDEMPLWQRLKWLFTGKL